MIPRRIKLSDQCGSLAGAARTVARYCKSASTDADWPCTVDRQYNAAQPQPNDSPGIAGQVSGMMLCRAALDGLVSQYMRTMSLDRQMNLLNKPAMNDQNICARSTGSPRLAR